MTLSSKSPFQSFKLIGIKVIANKLDFILIKIRYSLKQGKKSRILFICVQCFIHFRILFHTWIKVNCIFKVYEEPEEITPEKEEPVPAVEEEEPEAPAPAGTGQDPQHGKIQYLMSIIHLL